jgi:enoyl-CoA hydratase/carnithine racemase
MRVTIKITNHIADIKLNRPEKMNALDQDMFKAIIEAGENIKQDQTVRCVVLSGAGKCFCSGMDTENFNPQNKGEIFDEPLANRTHGIGNIFQQIAWIWREIPVPVIAAVHGVAIGGGLNIMSGADVKFITSDTKLSIMELKWGLIPDMAGSQLWRHNVREDIIRELMYTHRMFSGQDAVQYGFATHISEDPYEDAMKLAGEIASKNPTAIVKSKKMINEAPYLSAADGLMMESIEQSQIIRSKNQIEAVMAAIQKRDADFDNFRE